MQTRLIRPTATLGFKRNSAHDVWSTFFVRARDKNSLRKHGKCIYWMKHCVLRLPRYWTYVNSAVCWISVNQRGIFVWTCQIPWDSIDIQFISIKFSWDHFKFEKVCTLGLLNFMVSVFKCKVLTFDKQLITYFLIANAISVFIFWVCEHCDKKPNTVCIDFCIEGWI